MASASCWCSSPTGISSKRRKKTNNQPPANNQIDLVLDLCVSKLTRIIEKKERMGGPACSSGRVYFSTAKYANIPILINLLQHNRTYPVWQVYLPRDGRPGYPTSEPSPHTPLVFGVLCSEPLTHVPLLKRDDQEIRQQQKQNRKKEWRQRSQ